MHALKGMFSKDIQPVQDMDARLNKKDEAVTQDLINCICVRHKRSLCQQNFSKNSINLSLAYNVFMLSELQGRDHVHHYIILFNQCSHSLYAFMLRGQFSPHIIIL